MLNLQQITLFTCLIEKKKKKESLLFRMLILVTAVMCALGASAQEAYAVYTSDNTALELY